MIDYNELVSLNKSKNELIQILTPLGEENEPNQYLFRNISGDLSKFRRELQSKGIKLEKDIDSSLNKNILKAREEILTFIDNNKFAKKTKLDFGIAKLIHKNIEVPRRCLIKYDFWICLNLYYFIDIIKTRWEKNPSDTSNWYNNAKSIFIRSLGVDAPKDKESGQFRYSNRNKRIDMLRYWLIGERFYDVKKGYHYLDRISNMVLKEEIAVQDFLNQIEGYTLLSEDNMLSKYFAEEILLASGRYSENEIRKRFNIYNAYKNKNLTNITKEEFIKEIFR